MAHEIKWTLRAKESHDDIIKYLEKEWTEREIKRFINAVEDKLRMIDISPEIYIKTSKRKNIHKAIISKQTVLFYRYYQTKRRIELLVFWDTRRNPTKLRL
jgi:plasmid stabilization system protein ParE